MERTSSCMESDGLLTRHGVSKYAEKSSNIDLELSCLLINLLNIALAKVPSIQNSSIISEATQGTQIILYFHHKRLF